MHKQTFPILACAGLALLSAAVPAFAASDLTPTQARAIIAPLYDALNRPERKDVARLLDEATSPDWKSCSSNDGCVTRAINTGNIRGLGAMIPDLRWRIIGVSVAGNEVTVRGEASGTPVGQFFGTVATGRSFRIMAIDVHRIDHGKIVQSFHVENWMQAVQQVKGL